MLKATIVVVVVGSLSEWTRLGWEIEASVVTGQSLVSCFEGQDSCLYTSKGLEAGGYVAGGVEALSWDRLNGDYMCVLSSSVIP